MLVVEIVLAAVIVFAVFAVTLGRGGSMTRFPPDWPGRSLPEGRTLRAADIEAARFSLAFRGYRMAEVDLALDRLAAEIADRDAIIEHLTGQRYEAPVAEVDAPVGARPDLPDPAGNDLPNADARSVNRSDAAPHDAEAPAFEPPAFEPLVADATRADDDASADR